MAMGLHSQDNSNVLYINKGLIYGSQKNKNKGLIYV